MAKRLKAKLPMLSVTQRSTAGEVSHRRIPRGCVQQELKPSADSGALDTDDWPQLNDSYGEQQVASELPSLHSIAQRSAVELWEKIRPSLLQAAIESSAMPPNQTCISCCDNEALYRCLQCGPRAFFCHCCFALMHSTMNLFHTGEVWEVCQRMPIYNQWFF